MKSQNIVLGILIATSLIIAVNSSLVCDLVDFNVPVLNGLFENDNAQSTFCTKKYEAGMEKLRPESEYYMTFNSAGYMWDQTVEIYELDEYSVIEMGFYFNTKLGGMASYFDLLLISVIDLSTIIRIEIHSKPGWRIIQESVNTTNVNARIQFNIGANAQMTFMVEYIKISNNQSGAQSCLIDISTADSTISTISFKSTTEYSTIDANSAPHTTINYTPDESSISTPTDQNENRSTQSFDYSLEDSTTIALPDFTTGGSSTIIYDSSAASTMSDISTTHDISSISTNITSVITTDTTTFWESNNISTDLSNLSSIIPTDSTVVSTTSTSMELTNHSELQTALTDHGGITTDSTNGYSTSSVYSTTFDVSTVPSTSSDSTTVLIDSTTSNSVEFTNHSKPEDISTISADSTDNFSELPTDLTDHSGLTTDKSSPITVDSTTDSTNRYPTISVDSTNSDFLTTLSGSTINDTSLISSDSTNGLTSETVDSPDFSSATTILLGSTTVETISYDSTILVNSTITDYATSSDASTTLHDMSTVSSVSIEADISTISSYSTNTFSILSTDLTDTSLIFLTDTTTESASYLATGGISTIPTPFTDSTDLIAIGTLDTTTVDSIILPDSSTFESAPIHSTTSDISTMPSESTTSDEVSISSDSTDNFSITTSDSQGFSSTILLELRTTDRSEPVTVSIDSSTDQNDRTTYDSVTNSFPSTSEDILTTNYDSTDGSSTLSTITFASATESVSSTNWIDVDSTVTIDSVTENIPTIDHSFSVTLDATYDHSTISLSSTTESNAADNRSTDTSNFTEQHDSNEMDTTPIVAEHLKSEESQYDVWMVVALLFMILFCISIFVGLYLCLDIFRLVKSLIIPKVNNQQSRNETHINMNDNADEESFGTNPVTLIPRLVVNRTPNDGVWIHKASLSPFDSATSGDNFMWHRNRRSEFVV